MKRCARCEGPKRFPGNKYCFKCEVKVRRNMARSGYLQELPPRTPVPLPHVKERDADPAWENGVRAMENGS